MMLSALQAGSGSKPRVAVRWLDSGKPAQENKEGRRGSLFPSSNSSGNSNNNNNGSKDKKKGGSGPMDPADLWARYTQTTVMPQFFNHRPKKSKPKTNSSSNNTTGTTTTTAANKKGSTPATSPTTTAKAAGTTPAATGLRSQTGGITWGPGTAGHFTDPDTPYHTRVSLPCPSHSSCCVCVFSKQLGPVRVYFSRFRKTDQKTPKYHKRGSLAVKNLKNSADNDEDNKHDPEKVFLKARWLTSSAPSGEVIVPEVLNWQLENLLLEHGPSFSAYAYSSPVCSCCGISLLVGQHCEGCKHRHSHCFGHDNDNNESAKVVNGKKKKRLWRAPRDGLAFQGRQYFAPTPALPALRSNITLSTTTVSTLPELKQHSRPGTFIQPDSPTFDPRPSPVLSSPYEVNPGAVVTSSPHWLYSHRKDPTGFLRVPMNSPKGSRGPPRVDLGTGRNLGRRKDKKSRVLPPLLGDPVRRPPAFPERSTPVQVRLLSKGAQQ